MRLFWFNLHLFLFVKGLFQALSHGSVLLNAGGGYTEALCKLLRPGFGRPQSAL